MTPDLRAVDETTYQRRRAVVIAAVLSLVGVVALALRESAPHQGSIAFPALLVVGVLVYVAPFTFSVDRAMRQGRTRMAAVAFIGGSGAAFLATRPLGSFSQAWPLFTVVVSIVLLRMIAQFLHDPNP